jgi:hypothetical protein
MTRRARLVLIENVLTMCSQGKHTRELSMRFTAGCCCFSRIKPAKANPSWEEGKGKINKQTINSTKRDLFEAMGNAIPCICKASPTNSALLTPSELPRKFNALIIYLRSAPADSIYIIAEQAEVHYIVCEYN